MATKKKESIKIREPKRQPGYFQLYWDGKCVGQHLTLEEFLPKYFNKLKDNLAREPDLEKLIKQYEYIWKKKGKVIYIDSWGHKWNQGPSHTKLLNYLQNELSKQVQNS